MSVLVHPAKCAGIPPLDRTPAAVQRLRELVSSGEAGVLEWARPDASAAFSHRDAQERGFQRAVHRARSAGFEPFVRPVGGRLAAYHEGALVLDLLLRDADPRSGTTARFATLAEMLAIGLRRLGVDARVGRVPGEYCSGDWSVNAGGTLKLVGIGQRLVREAVLMTAVVVVADAAPLQHLMTGAYADLELELDPATVGSITDVVPGVRLDDVIEVLHGSLSEQLDLEVSDIVCRHRLAAPWTPR